MKYNIRINQRAIVEHFPALDLKDASLISFFKDFAHSRKIEKKIVNGVVYYRFDYDYVIEEMPLLHIKTEDGVYRRIKKLCDAGILESCPDNMGRGKSFFGFGEAYDLLISDSRNSDEKPKKVGQKSEFRGEKSDSRPSLGENTNIVINPPYEWDHTRTRARARIGGDDNGIDDLILKTPEQMRDYYLSFLKDNPGEEQALRQNAKYKSGPLDEHIFNFFQYQNQEDKTVWLIIPKNEGRRWRFHSRLRSGVARWIVNDREFRAKRNKYTPAPSTPSITLTPEEAEKLERARVKFGIA